MKTIFKWPNHFWFVLALCAMIFSGCTLFYPRPTHDPLAGFHPCYKVLDQSIVTDYQNYIQKLSSKEKQNMGGADCFEDGTGQHATRIEVDIGGKDCWYHILFYDKENKRIKVVKYFYGRYVS